MSSDNVKSSKPALRAAMYLEYTAHRCCLPTAQTHRAAWWLQLVWPLERKDRPTRSPFLVPNSPHAPTSHPALGTALHPCLLSPTPTITCAHSSSPAPTALYTWLRLPLDKPVSNPPTIQHRSWPQSQRHGTLMPRAGPGSHRAQYSTTQHHRPHACSTHSRPHAALHSAQTI